MAVGYRKMMMTAPHHHETNSKLDDAGAICFISNKIKNRTIEGVVTLTGLQLPA
ncbi:hypothetical protein [Ochrobactrum chromiisoli]|uniref:Uncharacterized protein n=1 Tax=Ochrobactrum chromiisoli TaxID=2993941 RepID=A0ABT3QU86_9HYPH|nr:hypothetical protein [Ochrobactrum chromiisoli]MCX2699192.1 hypothetical protein [Ochrobactrum chromiisoli]